MENIEKVCEGCGTTFTLLKTSRAGRFCSADCYRRNGARGKQKEKVKGIRMTLLPNHPLAPASGLIGLHRVALYEKIGPGEHPCHWCGKTIEWKKGKKGSRDKELVVDHLDHDWEHNEADNLVPSCNNCNVHRTKTGDRAPIKESEDVYILSGGVKTRAVPRTCELCGETFLVPPSFIRPGQARFCSRSCARKFPHRNRLGLHSKWANDGQD